MIDPTDRVRKARGERSGAANPANGPSGKHPAGAESISETGPVEFREVLAGVKGGPAEKRLGVLLTEIRRLAEVLSRRRLLEDLDAYRERVGEFLRVYLDEVLSVRETSRRGVSRRKQLLVVKRVNVELEDLSRLVLGGAEELKILKELGTIEGLLMDLYR